MRNHDKYGRNIKYTFADSVLEGLFLLSFMAISYEIFQKIGEVIDSRKILHKFGWFPKSRFLGI